MSMAYEITQNARNIVQSGVIEPQLVLRIQGYDDILSSVAIVELSRFGGDGLVFGKPGLVFGGTIRIEKQKDLISLNGTTNNISQQLLQDEGAASSTTNLTVALINKDNQLASLIKPVGNDDLLSKQAEVFLGVKGFSFPDDFIRIFVGNINQINTSGGLIKLTISHPEHLKRAELFPKIDTNLDGAINNSITTITLETTVGLIVGSDLVKSYVRINDELIRFTGKTATTITGCTRGQLGTSAASHGDGDQVESFYVLGDSTANSNAVDLALKLLISKSEPWAESTISNFRFGPNLTMLNSVFVANKFLYTNENVLVGDLITVTGATNGTNNLTNQPILQIEETTVGTFIRTAVSLVPEDPTNAVCTFTSQYNTLPEGLGLTPNQVDVKEYIRTFDLFSSSLPNYEFYLKDTISGKDLINQEILFPAACYSLPRKGAVSIGKTTPPFAEFQTVTLDETNVLNADDLRMNRSVFENFYNAIAFKFQEDALTDKFLRGKVLFSATSQNRVKTGNKIYKVESKGLRDNPDNVTVIEANAQRLIDRFQFGAEKIEGIKVPFSVGWNLEVGDSLVVQGLQLLDSKDGERELTPRVMEVVNRSFNFRQGIIELDILDTAFSIDGRYGVVSPSSQVGVGSTSTSVVIKTSFGTDPTELERLKWTQYIGQVVLVHSEDWSVSGTATLLGFSPTNDNVMLLSAGLAFTPSENYIIDIAHYDNAGSYLKNVHCFFNPTVLITANSMDQDVIEVATPSRFFVGSIIKVHSPDFSDDSIEAFVTDITGDVLTLDRELGYLPQIDDEVQLIGFVSDDGLPYRLL
jgi:hypothetical protein